MNSVLRDKKGIYENVSQQKVDGATYTPKLLADFVASEILKNAKDIAVKDLIRIFDPAIGDGQLLDSILEKMPRTVGQEIHVYGYETNKAALTKATETLSMKYPQIHLNFVLDDFLTHALESFGVGDQLALFADRPPVKYDLIIANPPYVRTQILGAAQSKALAKEFGLSGRVDLYYAFIIGISRVLHSNGVVGLIVSNRFMTTKSGSDVRVAICEKFNLGAIWDFGDTRLFEAAVLPAVLVLHGVGRKALPSPAFRSIYSTQAEAGDVAANPIDAINRVGVVALEDGRRFNVQHGTLENGQLSGGVWRLSTTASDEWLGTVEENTFGVFRDIGKIRVGIKTTADSVFIRSNWESETDGNPPELLRPLTTHHIARQYRAREREHNTQVLYPHHVQNGKRLPIDITLYPKTESYLLKHRDQLEKRGYVAEAGRKWYEIWVPQDPDAWSRPKLVFRDISESPMFWIDDGGSVVNGDCYWLICENGSVDLLWLAAAVANSTFIEAFYDVRFCNKLYAGRRRFITQYVEKFPFPNPSSDCAKEIVFLARSIYENIDGKNCEALKLKLDCMVWRAFGLEKEVIGQRNL